MIEVRFQESEDGPWITVQANSIDEAVDIIAKMPNVIAACLTPGGDIDGATS